MRNFTYSDAILKIRPEAMFTIHHNDYSTLQWLDQVQTQPSETDIIAAVELLQQEYENTFYRIQRSDEYPPIGDQLDALWKGGADAQEMLAKIQAVKAKYPKPTVE